MTKVGVIAEYNPFHNGHLYHLNKVKEMFPDSTLILILIGNFTQRGDISIINKWDKTNIALDYGYDLVIELPFIYATQAANYYAKGCIDILNLLNCNYLVFGSETNDVGLFQELVNKTNNSKYESLVKKYISTGINYPKACSLALKDVSNTLIDKPNDVLAFEYIKQIKNTNSKIIPVSIKRTNDYHDDKVNCKIVSATAIRKNINEINKIKEAMPIDIIPYINNINYNIYFNLLKYEIISNDNLSSYIDVSEGIENKLKKVINDSNTLEELINNTKSKRYSYNKIKRMLLHILCNSKKEDIKLNYIRVLGFSNNGQKILKEIKENDIRIITKFKKSDEILLKDDIKSSKIYSLLTNYDIKNEYQSSIKK